MNRALKLSPVVAACALGAAISDVHGATMLGEWSFEGIGPSLVVSGSANTGPYAAQGGLYVATSSASAQHASAATNWTAPVGNGSATAWSSNAWAIGDYYEFNTQTTGYEFIEVTCDITRSATGPTHVEVRASWDNWQTYINSGTYAAPTNGATPNPQWSSGGARSPAYLIEFDEMAFWGTNTLADRPALSFRIVSNSNPTNPGGLLRVDNFQVYGTELCCPADMTCDGGVDINDLLTFLSAFESGSLVADLDNGSGGGTPNGGVDINDLLYFLAHFEAGC